MSEQHLVSRTAMFAVLCGGVWLVYASALHAPLIFDDASSIVSNTSIVRLWPPIGDKQHPGPLNLPTAEADYGRPLVNLSLALNYHFGKLDPFGYHVFNLIIHILCALLLWRIIHRLLCLKYFPQDFAAAAEMLGFLAALLWGLHPLNTESVQYITQRSEEMYALFYLAAIYSGLRYWTTTSRPQKHLWLILASLSCLMGAACKEMIVTAPAMLLLLERTFIVDSFSSAIKKSWRLYLALLLSWILLFVLEATGPRAQNTGFHLKEMPVLA